MATASPTGPDPEPTSNKDDTEERRVDLGAALSPTTPGGSSGAVVMAPLGPAGQVVVTPPPVETVTTVSRASHVEISAEFTSSPYPPPEMLRAYNDAVPGLADRLVTMLEQESKHRRGIEARQADAEIEDMKAARRETTRGRYCGLAIGIVAILGGVGASIWGNPWVGGFIGTTGVVGLVSVFVLGRKATAEESKGN